MPLMVVLFRLGRYCSRMALHHPSLAVPIAERIEAQGLSYRQVSEATDIPLSSLFRKVKGVDEFKGRELFAVAEALGVKLSTLVREAERAA